MSLRDASDSGSDLGPDSESSDDDDTEGLEAEESDVDDDEFVEAEASVGLCSCRSGLLCSMLLGSQQHLSTGYACQSRLRNVRDIEAGRCSTAAGQISDDNRHRRASDLLHMSQGLLSWAADPVHRQAKPYWCCNTTPDPYANQLLCDWHACAASRTDCSQCTVVVCAHVMLLFVCCRPSLTPAALPVLYPSHNSDPAAEASRTVTFNRLQDVLADGRSYEVESSDAEDLVPGGKRRRKTPATIVGTGGHPQKSSGLANLHVQIVHPSCHWLRRKALLTALFLMLLSTFAA